MITKISELYQAGATPQQIDSVAKKLKLTSEEVTALANQADPTPEKKYEGWILRQMGNKLIRLPEDAHRVSNTIKAFVTYSRKKQLRFKDINQYAQIFDLEEEIEGLRFDKMNVVERFTLEEIETFPGVRVFEPDQSDDFVIAGISNEKSLMKLGLGTQWCTRGDYPNCMAKNYLGKSNLGMLFMVFKKTSENGREILVPTYQYTDDLDQFMDVRDRPVFHDIDSNLMDDIIKIFEDLKHYKPLFRLALERGESELIPNSNVVKIDPKELGKIVNKYINDEYERGSEVSENYVLWEIVFDYKVNSDILSDIASEYNLRDPLYYAISITRKRNDSLDDHLLDFEDNKSEISDLDTEYLLRYFKEIVYPNLLEEKERFDSPDRPFYYKNMRDQDLLENWMNFFRYFAEEIGPVDILVDLAKEVFGERLDPESEKILKNDPQKSVWQEYKDFLASRGYLTDIVEQTTASKKNLALLRVVR